GTVTDEAEEGGRPGARVEGVQPGLVGHPHVGEEGVVAGSDVEAEVAHVAGEQPGSADRVDLAGAGAGAAAWGANGDEGVVGEVVAVGRGGGGAEEVVAVAQADDGDGAAEVGVAGGVGQRRVGGATYDLAGVGVEAEVLAVVAGDADDVGDGVQVE